jgi:hypothetical protein
MWIMTTWYVAEGGEGAGNGTSESDALASIQAAVYKAGKGDTIDVGSGTYREQVEIDGEEDLTIRGVGSNTVIEAPDAANVTQPGIIEVTDSTDVEISGLAVDGRGQADPVDAGGNDTGIYGINYENSSGTVEDVEVSRIRQNGPDGDVGGAQRVYGINVTSDDGTDREVTIRDSVVRDFQKNGIDLNGPNLEVILENNVVTGAGATNATAQNGISLVDVAGGSVSGNKISAVGYTGDKLDNASAISTSNINGVTFDQKNILTGADDRDADPVGIFLDGTDLSFNDNVLEDFTYGVFLNAVNNTSLGDIQSVSDNSFQIDNAGLSIFADNDLGTSQFGRNTINGSSYDQVVFTSLGIDAEMDGTAGDDALLGLDGDDTLSGSVGNDLYIGNDGDDVAQIADGGGAPVTMADFSFSDESVNDGTYEGRIETPQDGTETVSGIEVLEVTNTGSSTFLVRDGMSIQAAVDVAEAGDTVLVEPGDYEEQITVDKGITLRGPESDTAGNANVRGDEATINGQVVVEADDATVEGFTISPDASKIDSNDTGEVLRVSGGADNVTIQNNIVRDVDGNGLDESLDAINVFGGSAGDPVEDVVISGNFVTAGNGQDGNGFSGISIQGNVLGADVSNNEVNDVGDSSAYAFGIVVRATDNHSETPDGVEISENDIRNISSNGNFAYSAGVGIGIESEHTGVDTIEDNTVRNVDFLLEEKDFPINYNPDSGDENINNSAPDIPDESQVLIERSTLESIIQANNWAGAYVVDSDGNLVTPEDGDVVVFDRQGDAQDLAGEDDNVQTFDFIPSTGGDDDGGGGDDDDGGGSGGGDDDGGGRFSGGGGGGAGAGGPFTPNDDIVSLGDGPNDGDALAGDDIVYGNAGADSIVGNLGADQVYGNQGVDEVYGNQGDDLVFGGQDDDLAFGGQDDDQVYGNRGDDQVYGNQGEDDIFGGEENDDLFGGQGGDRIYGNLGDDRIYGNLGNDTLVGGEGDDEFAFLGGDGQDTVADFGDGDTISLRTDINDTGVQSFADLTITENDTGDAVIDLGGDNSLTVEGVSPDGLSESDFSFF